MYSNSAAKEELQRRRSNLLAELFQMPENFELFCSIAYRFGELCAEEDLVNNPQYARSGIWRMDWPGTGPYRRANEEAMSQHKHSTQTQDGKKVTVTLGYDRPLDYVFCTVIQEAEGTNEGEEVLYSNLSDDEAGTDLQDVDYFRGVMNELGISVPDALFTEVKIDQLDRVGNRTVVHE